MERPRDILARDLFLNVMQVHERLAGPLHALFRDEGTSLPQYNVLRILRGGPAEGLSCQDIRSRLLARVPDVTRLVDRMAREGLASRHRHAQDRRVVLVRLTPKGRTLCDRLDPELMSRHRDQTRAIPLARLRALNEGLQHLLDPA